MINALFRRRSQTTRILVLLLLAFNITPSCLSFTIRRQLSQKSIKATTILHSRQARRNLPKRRRRNQGDDNDATTTVGPYTTKSLSSSTSSNKLKSNDAFWETSEIRPLNFAKQKEAGVDYWIDPIELQKLEERKRAKRIDPGQIPDDKLWTEVLSPYKQNWIGIISVSIIALAFIFKNFPEVIDPPIISNVPDVL